MWGVPTEDARPRPSMLDGSAIISLHKIKGAKGQTAFKSDLEKDT